MRFLRTSFMSYNAPLSGDSQTTVDLTATLLDVNNAPVVGRTVSFTLDGLPAVSGITDASGIARGVLFLELAPGDYPLQVSFTGDGAYSSSSTSTTFTVTESWSAWIQDSQADYAAGTGDGVDMQTRPGSVILLRQSTGGGEESGSFTLGSGTWSNRRRLLIDNPNTSNLPAGYSIKLSLDTANMVTSGKLLANGNDLRLVYTGGPAPLELDRVADTAFNTASTEIWFKSQVAIPAGGQDSTYYIYYNNPAASTPPTNPANVFAIYDGFDDTVINTTLWTQNGIVSESGGWARLSTGSYLFGRLSFTYGLLEMRIQALAEDSYMWWGWEDLPASAPNYLVFEEYPAPTNLTALMRNDSGTTERISLAQPSGGLTSPHLYTTDWRLNLARWYIDGAQVYSDTTGVPDTPMQVIFNAYSRAFNIDWARVRLAAPQEPVVSLASSSQDFVSLGAYTSPAYDTSGYSGWKYLVWSANQPAGTNVTLSIRTANTQDDLDNAAWLDYPQSGQLINNFAARWIQYRAALTTADPSVTPELQRVVIYYLDLGNHPLAADDNYVTDEDTALTVPAPGVLSNDSDPDNIPLTSLLVDPPAHGSAALSPDGSFTYIPNANFNGSDSFTYVADNGVAQSNTAAVSIVVNPVNDPPVLNPTAPMTVTEETLLAFSATATDPDIPADTLAFSLLGAPTGASIDPLTGAFSWTPAEIGGSQDFTFDVCVSDGAINVCQAITVTVLEANGAPVISTIGNQTTIWGNPLTFTATAADDDLPADTLTFSLIDAPPGASIHGTTGAFTWTPTSTQVGSSTFKVRVTVSGILNLFDEETITVTVSRRPTGLVYSGATSGQYSDPVTLLATLTDNGGGSLQGTMLPQKSVSFTIGSQTASGTTNTAGLAQTSITLNQAVGIPSGNTNFAGDSLYLGSSDSDPLQVIHENAYIEYTGDSLARAGRTLNLRATVWDSAATGYVGASQESGAGVTIGDLTRM
ncbi:MAG: hypothetical protein A2W35_18405 [Chloroflexi bacterium RBG_16_57_11]|nr:MAG: hypothetical protein A2W35_18405 [Chloroflexi bacterium RBG_16_57_11]